MKTRFRIVLVNKDMFDALQAQVEQEALLATNGLACVVGGLSTTSVRMARKMARWDA